MPESDNAVVLIADGEPNVLQDVSSTLEKAGYTVVTALGRPAVMDLCACKRERIQLAILDMTMLENGPEVVERLDQSYPGIRILLTSIHDESEAARRAGPSGRVRGFIRKPFRRSQLLGRVMKAIDTPLAATA
jgi:response regulator RpfG family c-di-GMP phosphodiesterase